MIPEQTTVILDLELYRREGIWWQNHADPFRIPNVISQEIKTILNKIETISSIDAAFVEIKQAAVTGRGCVEQITLTYDAKDIGKMSRRYERVEFYAL